MDLSSLPGYLDPSSDLLDREISPPQFVIRPYFPAGELTEIVGAHGAFKSTIALDACLAVATGRAWGGVPTAKGRSVFITLEDSADTLARRVKAWLDGVHMSAALWEGGNEEASAEREVRENFSFLARERSQGLVLTKTGEGTTSALLDVADHLAQLITGASLVVIETASRLHDGPETNDAFAAFVRALERLARTGAAIALVRHMSKKAAREMKSADQIDSYAGRGGGALADAVRSCLVVTRHDDGRHSGVTLTAAKTTHANPGATVSWVPRVVAGVDAVRLEVCTPESQARADADLLWAFLAARDEGVTRKWLHNNAPPALGRERAKQALDYLATADRVFPCEERRGRNNQKTTVFYAHPPESEAA